MHGLWRLIGIVAKIVMYICSKLILIGSQELGPVVALNQMGCGLGGLDWAVVQTYYEQFLTQIPETRFIVWIQRK